MIRLTYFTEADIEQLVAWNADTSAAFLMQWSGKEFTYPLTKAQIERYMQESNKANATKLIYKVIDEASNQVIGFCALNKIDYQHKSARISKILIGESSMRGKGFGRQIIQALLQIGFETLHLHRISLGVFDFNQAAISCYKNVGLKVEGVLRDTCLVDNEYWSLYEMSMLEQEYNTLIQVYN
ncbi:IS4 family transposase ISBce8 [Paraliobacillus ryukyuensis]|uniref:RimJ/RimL family protein N-acetyltransferase n=1 Tax=Paraliobacillus ryukyuensis TaxID=200904 RepID=A0A366EC37_9BACI|nr:GNAT family protein [Paraliobacillus ryukyuensis]RBO99897.1 RimJ/RimL family protein N-acetyltransferase [Paraliobacillus ryukyuensis]